jgi:hypothetical protein
MPDNIFLHTGFDNGADAFCTSVTLFGLGMFFQQLVEQLVRIFCKSLKKVNQYRWVKQSLPTATRLLIGVNAINKTMLLELDAALDDIEKNDSVYTVVINGNGRAFCAGFDLQAGIEANLKGEE